MNDILFGNNNKAVIKKLANRSFRSNKMRNVIAVIAIALTTFLFTAVLTIGMGAKGTLEYNMAKMIGTGADALVQGLSEEQFQQLKENSMFEKVGCWVPIEIMTNTNRIFAEIDYADQPQLELRMQTPRTGSAPQKANEVLVSANILNDLNIEEKIGAEIPIEFKNRQSGQMYHFDMIVSGIYDTPNEKSESVIVSKAFMEENPEMMNEIAQGREGCGIYDADVIMRDSSMIKERISEFVRSIGGNPDDRSAENYVRVAPNTFLSNNSGGSIMWLVAGVFGVLFMFCGYLLIYNVFEIAVTNDIRQYGLLRTVGTTSQQIKRLVNRQALYLFLIGTPFGLLFGILLGRSILPAALQMFAADYSGKNIEVSTLPYLGIIVGAILFSGLTVYTEEEKAEDPDKADTGLFFFKGDPGAKFAVCNAGGGFAYVGAMQDSCPHALEISKRGYNAFALIYRPGAQTACEDLARAISFIFEHAEELEVDTKGYSFWGGSARARMAAWLGSYGPAAFGGDDLPQPSAVIMQYTGHSDYTENDPPTFACVGESDGIANWRTMQRRIEALDALGIPTEFHHYPGLPHGFGLGTGTVAEGWLDEAAQFWEAQM